MSSSSDSAPANAGPRQQYAKRRREHPIDNSSSNENSGAGASDDDDVFVRAARPKLLWTPLTTTVRVAPLVLPTRVLTDRAVVCADWLGRG